MKDKPEKSSSRRKKPYVRPEVKQVPLRPEEAVLGNCKGSTGSARLVQVAARQYTVVPQAHEIGIESSAMNHE